MEGTAVDDDLVSAVQQNQGSSGCDGGFGEPPTNEISTTGEDEVHGEDSVVLPVLVDLSWEGVEASRFEEGW